MTHLDDLTMSLATLAGALTVAGRMNEAVSGATASLERRLERRLAGPPR